MPNASFAGRLNGKLHQVAGWLIVAFVIAAGFGPMLDNVDLGWHVAQGRWMVGHVAIYRHDFLNYPNLGHPVIDEYPCFQIVLYLATTLGWWGPCLLTALAYTLLIWMLFKAGKMSGHTDSALLILAIGLMLVFFQVAFPLRPHLITYLAIATLGVFLLRHREPVGWMEFWPVALLQVAWVNSHSAFVLGPAMVGLFGMEMVARHWIRDRAIPWRAARNWFGALLLILLACWINPYGADRFYLPFYQDQLESIRAYVGEMEPLHGGAATLYQEVSLVALAIVILALITRRGAITFSFLFFVLFFYVQAQSVIKAWPIVGVFIPLLVLGSGALSRTTPPSAFKLWASVFGHFLATVVLASCVYLKLNPALPTSIQAHWRELDRGRSELSVEATAWMKSHGVEGRLFHRCEDGGLLQQEGYDQGETFADTGFGKYDEAFIHEVGSVGERPGLLPRYLAAYRPDYVVCSTFCYQWPFYLRQNGWRLIFYTPNSSVWIRPDLRSDLPTISNQEVEAAFSHDIATYGRPGDVRLYGRNLIALQSLGVEDFVFAQLHDLPADLHHAAWYWEAARFICFSEPAASPAHRDDLLREAESLHDDVTSEFRAYAAEASGDTDGALGLLQAIPPSRLGGYSAELLLKIELERKMPEALALALRPGSYDLRSGRHWQYLAQAEEQAGNFSAAASAWKKAIFYYPDDGELMTQAAAFEVRYPDPDLSRAIADSAKVYGHHN